MGPGPTTTGGCEVAKAGPVRERQLRLSTSWLAECQAPVAS